MNQTDNDKSFGQFKIHNIGFYNLVPRQIKCLSYNKKTLKLALSRDDASIEIWDMRAAVFMEKCILGHPSSSVEGLGWLGNRLFSTGQGGDLTEWNLTKLIPKTSVTLTGNASYCMDIDHANDCIAVGTQGGFINTFSVDGDDLNFSRVFDKQEGAIWCCKYDSTGSYIVTGSTDVIRIWNVSNGHVIHKMTPGRSENKKETNVMSLVVLKDLTIIAGDSRGYITIWNGETGNRIDSIQCFNADVLAVAVNYEETFFCCSGVDPKIKIFVPITKANSIQRRWIRNLTRSVHDHDVKALTFIDEKRILSGGVDGYLKVSTAMKENKSNLSEYGPFLPQPCAVVAMPSRLILLKHFNYVEVWRLGRPTDMIQLSDDNSRHTYSMEKNQERIIDLRSLGGEPITCASISQNGEFLVYSTESRIRLFQLDTKSKKPSATKVLVASDKFKACAKVLFSSDSKTLFCVKSSGDIEIFALSYNDDVDFKTTISTDKAKCAKSNVPLIKDAISLVCVSKCGKYLACAGACGSTVVWECTRGQWSNVRVHSIKSSGHSVTAMAINSQAKSIVLAFSNYMIYEYGLTNDAIQCVTKFNSNNSLQNVFKNRDNTAITNILIDENNQNFLILHNDTTLFVLEKCHASQAAKHPQVLTSTKRRKSLPEEDSPATDSTDYYKLNSQLGNYKHFVHLSWLSPTEIVAVTEDPVTLIEQLPPSMKQKHFGIS